jgi:hypothetical protein
MDQIWAQVLAAGGTAAAGIAATFIGLIANEVKSFILATLIHRTVQRGAGLAYLTLLQKGETGDAAMAEAVATATEYATRRVGTAIAGRGLSTPDVMEMARAQVGVLLGQDPQTWIGTDEVPSNLPAFNLGTIPVSVIGDEKK